MVRNQSENTRTYQNLFVDCERAIAYGMGPEESEGITSSHVAGTIYNNFIYRRRGFPNGDAGIMLWDSSGTQVYHNTIMQYGTYANAIEYRFPSTTDVDIRNT